MKLSKGQKALLKTEKLFDKIGKIMDDNAEVFDQNKVALVLNMCFTGTDGNVHHFATIVKGLYCACKDGLENLKKHIEAEV